MCILTACSAKPKTYIVIAVLVLICFRSIGSYISVCFVDSSKRLHTPIYVMIGYPAVSDVLVSVAQYVRILPGLIEFFYDNSRNVIYWTFTFLYSFSIFFI